jgi:hypothetical protein
VSRGGPKLEESGAGKLIQFYSGSSLEHFLFNIKSQDVAITDKKLKNN